MQQGSQPQPGGHTIYIYLINKDTLGLFYWQKTAEEHQNQT